MNSRRRQRQLEPARHGALVILADGLMIFLILTGLFFSVTTAYGIPFEPWDLLGGCVLWTAVFLAVFSMPKCRWIPLLLLGFLYGYAVWRLWDELVAGAMVAADAVTSAMAEGFSAIVPMHLAGDLSSRQQAAMSGRLLAALLPIFALAMSWSVVRARSGLAVFAMTLPPLLPILFADGMPAWTPFLLLAACWLMLLLGSLCAVDPAGMAKLRLLSLPVVAALLGLLTVLLPRASYERPSWTEHARTLLQSASEAIPGDHIISGFLPGGSDVSVRLDDAGPRTYTGEAVLLVESEAAGHCYLRGGSAAIYTGDAWEPLDETDYAELLDANGEDLLKDYEPLNFPYLTGMDRPYYSMQIEYINSLSGQLFTPYQLATAPNEISGVRFVDDSHIEREFGTWQKTVYYSPQALPSSMHALSGEAASAEWTYRQFVYDHYLEVPAEFEGIFSRWLSYVESLDASNCMQWEPPENLLSEHALPMLDAAWVASLLDFSAEYDLDVSEPPEGTDFLDYFLNGTHRGYCVHFASAGTLLLRYLGVPARYVSGYAVTIPASGQATVRDSDAHAWVEIYLDGYGWYPVEMTPKAISTDPMASLPEDTEPVTLPEEPTELPPAEKPEESPPPVKEPEQPEIVEAPESGPGWWIGGSLTAILVAAMWLWRRIRLSRLKQRLCGKDANRSVIEAYLCLQQLEPWGIQISETAEELARKAKFSQHKLTDAERMAVLSELQESLSRIDQTLSWPRRLWFRYIWGNRTAR